MYAPFEEEGYIALQMLVGPSVRWKTKACPSDNLTMPGPMVLKLDLEVDFEVIRSRVKVTVTLNVKTLSEC